jgi:hypothetical protein
VGSRLAGARQPPRGPWRRPGPHRTRTPRPGKCGTLSSGYSLQARCDPGCLPGFRFPSAEGLRRGVRPGRSSADGGIDEFPLFREASRSSRSTLAARSATCPASLVFSAASTSITRACITITASRAASGGIDGTGHPDRANPVVIKPERWASTIVLPNAPYVPLRLAAVSEQRAFGFDPTHLVVVQDHASDTAVFSQRARLGLDGLCSEDAMNRC